MTKKVGSAGRYGPRYGTRTKKIVAAIEREQCLRKDCPYCERPALKRVAAGVWECHKCGKKFAGGAYFPQSAASQALARAALESLRVETLKRAEQKTKKE
jgi:large subunit ribosomal protein L37Ae